VKWSFREFHGVNKKMQGKIESQFAIGVILLVAIISGGIIWLNSARLDLENPQSLILTDSFKNQSKLQKTEETSPTEENCKPHYYEGEAQLKGWLVSSDQSGSAVVIRLKDGEAKKLPAKDTQSADNFTVKLIDPTDRIKKELQNSTQENPVVISIRGYAEVCQQPPLISLEQATTAFKKS
jgi:hypothetical protein